MHAPEDGAPRTVVVALDGLPAAEAALPVARHVAIQLGAHLIALHATPPSAGAAATERRLRLGHPHLDDRDVIVRRGRPASVLLDVAADPANLLALTTHSANGPPNRCLGSTAAAVIAGTMRPILLVRPTEPAPPAQLRRLLIPLDGAPSTFHALPPVLDLALRLGATLDLLFVLDPDQPPPDEPGTLRPPTYLDQPHHEWSDWSQEVQRTLAAYREPAAQGMPTDIALTAGPVPGEILRVAAERQVDAIVLVRRCRLEPGHGGILRAVLAETTRPVLLTGTSATKDATWPVVGR